MAWAVVAPARAAQPARARSDWPHGRATGENRATTDIDVDLDRAGALHAWTFAGTDRAWGYEPGMAVWTSAAIGAVGGRSYLVAGSYDRNVYCIDAVTGKERWRFTTGAGVSAAPILWDSGEKLWVFATSSDRLLYALDATNGERMWVHVVASFRPTLGGARLSTPAVGRVRDMDFVFFGHWVWDRSVGENTQAGGVTALDARTGEVMWKRRLGDNEITAPIFAEALGRPLVFVGSANGNTYALDAIRGGILWQRTELDAVRSPPAFAKTEAGSRVVTASKSGVVRCLAALTGEEVWSYRAGDWVIGSPAIAEIDGRKVVFVGSYDRSVHGIDLATGKGIWRTSTRGGIYGSLSVVDAPGGLQVVAPSWDHYLHGFDGRTGADLWRTYTGRPLWDTVGLEHSTWSSPVAAKINGDWLIYHGSYNGTLYAFPLAELMHGSGLAQRSNVLFWLSFPPTLIGVFVLAVWLSRRRADV